jgi:hypothetical protein
MEGTCPIDLKAYLMERRHILRDELATIEKQLSLPSKERQLQDRVRDLEERLLTKAADRHSSI